MCSRFTEASSKLSVPIIPVPSYPRRTCYSKLRPSSISGLQTVPSLPSRSYILPNCDCFHYHVFTCVEQQAHMFNVWGPRHRLYDSSALHIVGEISYTPLPIVRIHWFLRNLLYIDLMAALHSRPRLRLYWPMGFTRQSREHPCFSVSTLHLSLYETYLPMQMCMSHSSIYLRLGSLAWYAHPSFPLLLWGHLCS